MFTAWFGDGPAPADAELIGPLRHLPQSAVTRDSAYAGVLAGDGLTSRHAPSGVRVWLWGRIDNADALRSRLNLGTVDDADIIVNGYLRWGTQVPQHLTGDFSVCVYDPRDDSIHAFRDPIGIRPLTVAQASGTTVVTTAPGVLWTLPGFDDRPSAELITQHALRLRIDSTVAAHPQSQVVAPGCVFSDRHGNLTETRYHRFDPHSPWESSPQDHWVSDFRATLDAAVAARVPNSGPIGLEFSGGLDSVGIASLLVDLDPSMRKRIRAYGFSHFELDEPTIRAAAADMDIAAVEVQRHYFDDHSRWRAAEELIGTPLGHHMSFTFSAALGQCAALGGTVMFSGHGGDHGVTNFALQAPQEWLSNHAYLSATRYALPVREPRRALGTIKLAVRGVQLPPRPAPSLDLVAQASHLRRDALESAGIATQLLPRRAAGLAPTVNGSIVDATGIVDRTVATYWSFRASESNVVASLYGMTYAFPLLDAQVIQQFLRTPTIHKYRKGLGRYLFREALGASTPANIRWALDKYMGTPIRQSGNTGTDRPTPALTDAEIHPWLAELLDSPALPTKWPATLPSKNGMHGVNRWLMEQFPEGT
jgi:asparagine synthase (glutamine-hydrolysing)